MMPGYDNPCNSEEAVNSLVLSAQNGDSDSVRILMEQYEQFARSQTRSYFLPGGDREDLEQEALLGLYKAILSFDVNHGASFISFARLCVVRQIITAVKGATRKKNDILNSSASFDAELFDSDVTLLEILPSTMSNPEKELTEKEEYSLLWDKVIKKLSRLEKEVFYLRGLGLKYSDIAQRLGRSEKAIDNAVHRIRIKSKKLIDNDP